jgi:hypothetical protein
VARRFIRRTAENKGGSPRVARGRLIQNQFPAGVRKAERMRRLFRTARRPHSTKRLKTFARVILQRASPAQDDRHLSRGGRKRFPLATTPFLATVSPI